MHVRRVQMIVAPITKLGSYTDANEALHRAELTVFVKILKSLNLYNRESSQDLEARYQREVRERTAARDKEMPYACTMMHFNLDPVTSGNEVSTALIRKPTPKRKKNKKDAPPDEVSAKRLCQMQKDMEIARSNDQQKDALEKAGNDDYPDAMESDIDVDER